MRFCPVESRETLIYNQLSLSLSLYTCIGHLVLKPIVDSRHPVYVSFLID